MEPPVSQQPLSSTAADCAVGTLSDQELVLGMQCPLDSQDCQTNRKYKLNLNPGLEVSF